MSRTCRSLTTALPGIALLMLSGCATMIHGSRQQLTILSEPAGAAILIDSAPAGRTPLTIQLSRRQAHQVTIATPGYRPYQASVERHVSGWAWANLLSGPWAAVYIPVDLVSGGFYNLQPEIIRAPLILARDPLTQGEHAPEGGEPAPAHLAQVVMVGSRVRVHRSADGVIVVGTATGVRGDTLDVTRTGTPVPVSIRLAEVHQMELGVGRRGHAAEGAVAGLLTGALAGWMLGVSTYRPCEGWCLFSPRSRDDAGAWGAVVLGLVGVSAGAVIGARTETDRWQSVPLDAVRVGVAPLPAGGIGLGGSIRF